MFSKLFLMAALCFTSVSATASHDRVEIDGICYYLNSNNNTSTVAPNGSIEYFSTYSGDIVIPKFVVYEGIEYNVVSIGEYAFAECKDLISVTIPNSVTSICKNAFSLCDILTTVTIPNSVISIGSHAFDGCKSLCNISLPNYISIIESSVFANCSSLESISIPEGVTAIKEYAFYHCSNLESISIPEGVTAIGQYAFFRCSRLQSAIIPNSVTSIQECVFGQCSNLASVTLGTGLAYVGLYDFGGCSNLKDIICYTNKAPKNFEQVFTGIWDYEDFDYSNITLHVHDYAIESFKELNMKFKDILVFEKVTDFNLIYKVDREVYKAVQYKYDDKIIPEPAPEKKGYTFSGWSEIPERMPGKDVTITGYFTKKQPAEKCAAPTIEYNNGKLLVNSDTKGAACVTSITSEDVNTHNGNEIEITATYNISAYAKAEGYENSEIVTATLCWIEVEETGTHINEQIKAKAVLIRSHEGTLWITGPEEGTLIEVYNVAGHKIVSVYATTGTTMVETGLNVDDVALVKIKNKTVKVVMR